MPDIRTSNETDRPSDEHLTTADLAAAADDATRPSETRTFADQTETTESAVAPLFGQDEVHSLRERWTTIQSSFVDEPPRAVEQADALVADAIKRLAQMFADERQSLERQWSRGDEVSTEDLRQALQRYRSFFSRLLAV
jgi:hypothetical protein